MDFVFTPPQSQPIGDVVVPSLTEVRDTIRKANPSTSNEINEVLNLAVEKAAKIAGKIGLVTVPIVPLSILGVPPTTKPFKTPLPGGLVVGVPAGLALTEMVVTKAGDPVASGEEDRQIALSLARAQNNAMRRLMKSPSPPMWDADP